MPQQIDVRIIESATITITQNFAAPARRIVTLSPRHLCRNVDVNLDKEQADNLRFCIRLDMRRPSIGKKVRDQDRSIQDGHLSADQAPMKLVV
jgi:hypothetical protein